MLTSETLDTLLHETASHGRRHALVEGDSRIRLTDFDAEVTKLAASLTRLGIRAQQRVALVMPGSVDALACFFAVMRAGAVAVPVNPLAPTAELTKIFTTSAVSAVVTATATAGQAADEAMAMAAPGGTPSHGTITGIGGTPLHITVVNPDGRAPGGPLHTVVNPGARAPGAALHTAAASQAAAVFCTTGTTGEPRPVVHTHRSLVASVQALDALHHSYFKGSGPQVAARLFRLARVYRGRLLRAAGRQRWLTPMPFHSIAGLRFMVQAIVTGHCLVVVPAFHPRAVIETVARERVNILALTPTMLEAILTVRTLAQTDLSSLLVVGLGSAPASASLIHRGEAMLGCPVLNGYGSTETAGGILVTRVGDRSDGSVGYPFPGTEILVADDTGQPVPAGAVGELLCRTSSLMASRVPQGAEARGGSQTEAITPEGWFHTGDLARVDDRGAVHIVGRLKDLIIRGGANVVPATVENVLMRDPAVHAAAVVGIADRVAGERIVAFVVAADPASVSIADVLAGCRSNLSPHEMPDHILLISELPTAETGEVRKVELRVLARERLTMTLNTMTLNTMTSNGDGESNGGSQQ